MTMKPEQLKENLRVAVVVVENKASKRMARREQLMKQIRMVMAEKNISEKDLSMRLGRTVYMTKQIVRGHVNLTIDTIYELADALGMDMDINIKTT